MYKRSKRPFRRTESETGNPGSNDETTIVEEVVENDVNDNNEVAVDVDEEGEASEMVREPRDEVDEGEEIPALVEQMQREVTKADVPEDKGSDNITAQGYVTPELLDTATDKKHRSYFSAVLGTRFGQVRPRVALETMA